MNPQKSMRRLCTHIGIALLLFMASSYLCVWLLEVLLFWKAPDLLSNTAVLMLLNDISIYGVGTFVFWLLLRSMPAAAPKVRGMTPARFGKLAIEAIGLLYSTSIVTNVIVALLTEVSGQEMTNIIENTIDSMSIGAMVLFTVIIAPICEEFLFRRLLFRRLLPLGKNFAIVVSAVAFGLYHCNLYQLLYATALGLLFSAIVAKTGRITYTIALHALINFIGSVLVIGLEPYPTLSVVYTLIIYALMIVGLVVLLRDYHALVPSAPSRRGCWKAALTSPGLLTCWIILGALSVFVTFLI